MDKSMSIFLDTNVIQSFVSRKNGSDVNLNSLGIRPEYHKLINFLDENSLRDRVEVCIPEIVVMEMKQHMICGFSKQHQSLSAQIEEHKKVFGDIIDIGSVKVKYTLEEYKEFVASLFDDFFDTPKNFAKLVPYPKQGTIIDVLIGKAVSGQRPFFTGKVGTKEYTDAGFKDSVLAETIFEYHRTCGRLCVLITHDRDFGKEFQNTITDNEDFVLFSSIDGAINAIEEYYGTNPKKDLTKRFVEEKYWHEYLLNEAGIKWDDSMSAPCVEKVSQLEGEIFMVKISFAVNESKYLFSVKFDNKVNDIIEVNYQIEDN